MYIFQRACEVQLLAQGNGGELIEVSQPVLDTVPQYLPAVTRGAGAALAWPALLRRIDRLDASYKM
jgi:hypothetical protein